MAGRREFLMGLVGLAALGGAAVVGKSLGVDTLVSSAAITPTSDGKPAAPTSIPVVKPTETPLASATPDKRVSPVATPTPGDIPDRYKDLSRRQPKNQQVWTSDEWFPELDLEAKAAHIITMHDPKESPLLAFDRIRKIVQPGWQESAYQYEQDVIRPNLSKLGTITHKTGRCFALSAAGIIETRPTALHGEKFMGVDVGIVTKIGLLTAMHSWDILFPVQSKDLVGMMSSGRLAVVETAQNKGWFLIAHKVIDNKTVGVLQLNGLTIPTPVSTFQSIRIPVHYPYFDRNLGVDNKGNPNTLPKKRIKEVEVYRNPHLADAEDLIRRIVYPDTPVTQNMTRREFLLNLFS